jgi:nucleoside phosphorylase/5'-deoxynucleotidase YfbR-like HD superfamily hydrolase
MRQREFDYAVIVALHEEAAYFAGVVKCGSPEDLDGLTRWTIVDERWKPFGRGVLVSSGAMGHEPAKAAVTAAISRLGVASIVNVGIAGRVASDLAIGDVVIPLMTFDVTEGGKVAGSQDQPDFQHAARERAFRGSALRHSGSLFAANSPALDKINDRMRQRFPRSAFLSPKGLKVVQRPIGCVPLVGAHDGFRTSLARVNRNIAAMEMESAGIVAAAEAEGVETIAVRGISDGADFDKRRLEADSKDENRRFAMEAAIFALEAVLKEQAAVTIAPGSLIEILRRGDARDADWTALLAHYEIVFGHLLQFDRRLVSNPVATLAQKLATDACEGPQVLLGGKGVGKTTFLQLLHKSLGWDATGQNDIAVLLRISALESWQNGVLDEVHTNERVDDAKKALREAITANAGQSYVLIDGLNLTGAHRVGIVTAIMKSIADLPRVRLLISAETALDLEELYQKIPLKFQQAHILEPLDVRNDSLEAMVKAFAQVKNASSAEAVLDDIRARDVRFVDLFVLSRFLDHFQGYLYKGHKTLAERYSLLCASELSPAGQALDEGANERLSRVAKIAFEILISKTKKFRDIQDEGAAKLVSSHASVTNYLVARHLIDVIRADRASRARKAPSKLNFVFPNDVNSYTKQIMRADPEVESLIVDFILRRQEQLGPLARSHCAYLAGRVSRNRARDMIRLLREMQESLPGDGTADRGERLLNRSIFISLGLLGDETAAETYVDVLLSDPEEAEFNRGFHLEYYGDARFDSEGMFSRDDGSLSCNRTFTSLLQHINEAAPKAPPLIDLLTLLSLVQARLQRGNLSPRLRSKTVELLNNGHLEACGPLPDKVRGYIGRMREDLAQERFDLSSVLQDWVTLPLVVRSGWIDRKARASGDQAAYWQGRRLESIAEHKLSTLGLVQTFLSRQPLGAERYDKAKILEMILIHDLAEARVGDRMPGRTDPELEQEVLWQYGAFATYPGVGDLWRIPELFSEFTKGGSLDARIAQDFDRLQFLLQSRLYGEGMTPAQRDECEKTRNRITTSTVRGILETLTNFPVLPRFAVPASPV